MITDKSLLELYTQGFEDELDGKFTLKEDAEKRAYDLGRLHALVGDNARSVDYLTEEEILNLIKN